MKCFKYLEVVYPFQRKQKILNEKQQKKNKNIKITNRKFLPIRVTGTPKSKALMAVHLPVPFYK